MFYIYKLIDYKGFPFYIGITKNIAVRISEHSQCKGNNPAKDYRVRRSINHYGHLKFEVESRNTREEAIELEKELIEKFKHQIVNVQHGKNLKRKSKTRKSGRSQQCPYCLNWYKRIKAHKCEKSGEDT